MLPGFHTYAYKKNDNNLKVAMIRIFVFLGGGILALLKLNVVL